MSYPYYNNKPQYYDNNETRVVVQTEPDVPKWNWCAHGWSMFACFCCPWCGFSWMFAFCGLVCALGSYSDHKAGDYDRSRYKKSCAIGLTIVSIILGLGVIATVVYFGIQASVAVTSFIDEIQKTFQNLQNLGNQN